MRKVLTFALTLAMMVLVSGASHPHDFKAGKLLEIGTDERFVQGTALRSAVFTVQVADLIYAVRGDRIRRGSGDIGQGLIVGDSVQVAIDGDHLIFLKPDGKEMKTTIIKRTRAPSQ